MGGVTKNPWWEEVLCVVLRRSLEENLENDEIVRLWCECQLSP